MVKVLGGDHDSQKNEPQAESFEISRKKILAAIFLLMTALVIDTILSNSSDLIHNSQQSNADTVIILTVTTFALIIVAVFASSRYLLTGNNKGTITQLGTKGQHLSGIQKVVIFCQYALVAIFSALILETIFSMQYHALLLAVAITLGYVLGGTIMGLLCFRFLSWYKYDDKHAVQILLYGVAAALTASVFITTVIPTDSLLLASNVGRVIGPNSNVEFPTLDQSVFGTLLSISYLLGIISLLLVWSASVIMLRHYSRYVGKIRYWIVVSLPLASFVIGFAPIFLTLPSTSTYFDPNLAFFRILTISTLIGNGLLSGFVFFAIARRIRRNNITNIVTNYLTISGYGIAALYISLVANIAPGSFPPFGAIAYSFTGIASYMFMSGIYSTAISVSTDVKLRQHIRKSAQDEFKLIDRIGTASVEKELQDKMFQLSKVYLANIESKTGIQSSLNEEEVNDYLDSVIGELKKSQAKTTSQESLDKSTQNHDLR